MALKFLTRRTAQTLVSGSLLLAVFGLTGLAGCSNTIPDVIKIGVAGSLTGNKSPKVKIY